jgi:amino-acid N-acetyltransferase
MHKPCGLGTRDSCIKNPLRVTRVTLAYQCCKQSCQFVSASGGAFQVGKLAIPDNACMTELSQAITGLEESEQTQFVTWLRSVAPHIHAHRGKTFVVAFAGELVAAGKLNTLAQDVALLAAMGIKIVLVHGFRPQVEEQLRTKNHPSRFSHGMRVTDGVALDCAQEAAGQLRFEIEAMFSQGLPNTPMAGATVRLISGNFVTARPVGILDGVDFQHTGLVRKLDVQALQQALHFGAIVLLSPFGFSPTGEAFNLSMEDLATSAAVALKADKLLLVTEVPGVMDAHSNVIKELPVAEAEAMLAKLPNPMQPTDTAFYLQHALKACKKGVQRAHIIPFDVNGSLLIEIFTHDGVGTMIVNENLEHLREATIDDVGGILQLISPLESEGVLVKRNRTDIERDISAFSLIEHDGVIFGCAALYTFGDDEIAELACLAVNPNTQSQGDGERILKRIEQRARTKGIKQLFVLTTRAMHWFQKRGFVVSSVEALPPLKRKNYNHDRKSLMFVKTL